jgi:hypothetical protein
MLPWRVPVLPSLHLSIQLLQFQPVDVATTLFNLTIKNEHLRSRPFVH